MTGVLNMNINKYFVHDVKSGLKPWTHENFGGGTESADFNFIVFGDGNDPDITAKTLRKINLFNPDFTITTGRTPENVSLCQNPFFGNSGKNITEYAFVFKDVLFLNLQTAEDLSNIQLQWADAVLKQYPDVKWTFVFLPDANVWVNGKNFAALEQLLYERNYSMFAGTVGHYARYRRQGRNYYLVGSSGSSRNPDGKAMRGVPFGEFPQLLRVAIKNGEPQIAVINLNGMYFDDIVTLPKLQWIYPGYFQADRIPSAEQAAELEAKGLKIYRDNGGNGF
jgi:hypothetical protein